MDRHDVRIAVFNHKGGVGKTTLTYNIAAAMRALGHAVLLVDADPQCNLTSHLLSDEYVNELLEQSNTQRGNTIFSAIRTILDDGVLHNTEPIEFSDDLYLIPGDIQLADHEENLAELWSDCFRRRSRALNGTSAISQLVSRCTERIGTPFVFYDCGPNVGALNRAVLLDCDLLIVPAACDLFSMRALKTLGRSLVKWLQEWETVLQLAPSELQLLHGNLAVLGYLPQRFKIYGGLPAKSYAAYLPMLDRAFIEDVVVPLKRLDKRRVATNTSYKLGEIADLGSAASKAQELGCPIWEAPGNSDHRAREIKRKFAAVANAILARVNGA